MILAHEGSGTSTVVMVGLLVSTVAFWALWSGGPRRGFGRPLCWTAGMLALAAATSSWVEHAADSAFAAHMVQHLVLWVVAPPLLLAAHPVRTIRGALPALHARPVSSIVARRPGWRLVAAWTAVVVTMYGTHLTGLYDAALSDPWVHGLEHALYLGSSILLWSTVIGTGRSVAPARVGLAALTMGPLVLLAMVLTAAERPLYGNYVRQLGIAGALDDQRQGAAIMWIGMMLGFLPLLILSVWRWAQREQEAQERRERMEDLLGAGGDPSCGHT